MTALRRRDGRITAAVFSRNEAHLLDTCLPRLHDFDDVVVFDMDSTDETGLAAHKHGTSLVRVPFAPVVEAVRQIAVDHAETEWIFFVDADEIVPTGFRASLGLREVPSDVAAIHIRYENTAFGRQLRHVLRGSAKYSLMRCDLARYDDHRAHAPPTFSGRVIEAPRLVPSILHLNFRTVAQSFEKTIRYAESDPRGALTFSSPLRLPLELARDVVAGAWRDGRAGVVVVTMNAIGRFYAATVEWEREGYPDREPRPSERRLMVAADLLRRFRVRAFRMNRSRRRRHRQT